MADENRYTALYDLVAQMTESLDRLELDIASLPAEGVARDLYEEYQRRLGHVHSLFDRAADLFRDITFDPADPESLRALERKRDVDICYGQYRRLSGRLSRLREKGERPQQFSDDERERSMAQEEAREELPEEAPVTEQAPEPDEGPDADLLAAQLEEEAKAEAEKLEKKKANRKRQESLARAAKEREEAFAKEEAMRRAAAASAAGVSGSGEAQTTAADLRAERLRQEDEARLADERTRRQLEEQRAALEQYRQRTEESQRFEAEQKAHFDFSSGPSDPARPADPADPSPSYQSPYGQPIQPSASQSSSGLAKETSLSPDSPAAEQGRDVYQAPAYSEPQAPHSYHTGAPQSYDQPQRVYDPQPVTSPHPADGAHRDTPYPSAQYDTPHAPQYAQPSAQPDPYAPQESTPASPSHSYYEEPQRIVSEDTYRATTPQDPYRPSSSPVQDSPSQTVESPVSYKDHTQDTFYQPVAEPAGYERHPEPTPVPPVTEQTYDADPTLSERPYVPSAPAYEAQRNTPYQPSQYDTPSAKQTSAGPSYQSPSETAPVGEPSRTPEYRVPEYHTAGEGAYSEPQRPVQSDPYHSAPQPAPPRVEPYFSGSAPQQDPYQPNPATPGAVPDFVPRREDPAEVGAAQPHPSGRPKDAAYAEPPYRQYDSAPTYPGDTAPAQQPGPTPYAQSPSHTMPAGESSRTPEYKTPEYHTAGEGGRQEPRHAGQDPAYQPVSPADRPAGNQDNNRPQQPYGDSYRPATGPDVHTSPSRGQSPYQPVSQTSSNPPKPDVSGTRDDTTPVSQPYSTPHAAGTAVSPHSGTSGSIPQQPVGGQPAAGQSSQSGTSVPLPHLTANAPVHAKPRRLDPSGQTSEPDPAPKVFRYTLSGAEEWNPPIRSSSDLLQKNQPDIGSDNKKLYAALKASLPEEKAGPYPISPTYETQMRFNLELARKDYLGKQGTPDAAAALNSYKQQRIAYNSYKEDVKAGRILVERPNVMDSAAARRQETPVVDVKATSSSVQYFYKPTGVYGRIIENATLSGSNCEVRMPDAGRPKAFGYSAANPLVVSPAYESVLRDRADRASKAVNQAAAMSKLKGQPLRVAPEVNNEVALSTHAYTNFLRAKQTGQVVVNETSTSNTPDFSMWSERYYFHPRSSSGPGGGGGGPRSFGGGGLRNGGGGGGGRPPVCPVCGRVPCICKRRPDETTFQSRGDTPLRLSKETVEERVANIFGKSVKLKREGGMKRAMQNMGYRLETWGMTAVSRAGRKFYSMAQSGDEDGPATIRTFEQGRYYITTALSVARATTHGNVASPKRAATKARKRELLEDRTLARLSDKDLKAHADNLVNAGKARKAEIREMMRNGSLLDKDGRKALLGKMREHVSASGETRRAVSMQKLREKHNNTIAAAQELKKNKKIFITNKGIDKEIKRIRSTGEEALFKQFGANIRFTQKSTAAHLKMLLEQRDKLRAEIRPLAKLRGTLTFEERNLLKKLLEEHRKLNKELQQFRGIVAGRKGLDNQLASFLDLKKRRTANVNAWTNGLYTLYSFMLKPIQEGTELGARGLAGAANIVTNRHVRKLVKNIVIAEYKITRWKMKIVAAPVKLVARATGMDVAAQAAAAATRRVVVNSAPVRVGRTAAANVSRVTRAGAHMARDAAHAASAFVRRTAVRMTPQFVRTGATALRAGVTWAKERARNSLVGRAVTGIARLGTKTTEALKAGFSLVKGVVVKIALGFLAFMLAAGILITATELIVMTANSMILAPGEKDGKIDLKPYVDIIRGEQKYFENKLKAIKDDPDYDDVIIEYTSSTNDNARELLSMMAVRMSQDLDMETNPQVEVYLRSIFNDSHLYTTRKTYFKCSEGCETKEIKYNCGLDCPQDCTEDHGSYEVKYCPGDHVRVHVKVTVLGFDELFSADSMGTAQSDAVADGLIGKATVTYYCTEQYEHICNAGPPYETALGTKPTPGRTIAVDPNIIPLGSHVIIDGHEYVAEDTGGAIDGMRVDIVVETHAEALAKGTRYNVPVYKVGYEGEGIQDTGKWNGWTQDNIDWCKLIYSTDWSSIYSGIDGLANIVGTDTDLSGVKFVDGDRPGNQRIVDIAKNQQGNIGGQPYWSWYGFDERVEWCACFVSWCANEAGVLYDSVPKFAACQDQGVAWFKNRGQWAKRGDITPVAGDIIFFDWEPNGEANHVGIVVGSDANKVYTVEGNSGNPDRVRIKEYSLDSPYILGYGIPNY